MIFLGVRKTGRPFCILHHGLEVFMKKIVLGLLVLVFAAPSFATIYTVGSGYFSTKIYQGDDTLLMTGGGINSLTAKDYSVLDIRNTSPFSVGSGGIGTLILANNSQLIFSGGQAYRLDAFWNATATISGGQINKIAGAYVYASTDHIKIVCETYNYNTATKILTGTWQDNSAFSIQLIDTTGYTPTWSNITIIPEPTTLLLLGVGGLLIRRKK
jgi:hypothetical protein